MRIVDRKTFLAMSAGTIFMKFPAQPDDEHVRNYGFDEVIAIKGETIGNDFVVQSLFPWFVDTTDSESYFEQFDQMLTGGESPPLDYDCAGRDGLFDDRQLFAVWSADDAERLIERLKAALSDGYPNRGGTA